MLHASTRQEMYYTQRPWKWLKSSNEPRKIRAVYRTIWTARAMIWPQQPENLPTGGQHMRPRVQNCATHSGRLASDVRLTKQFLLKQEKRCTERSKSNVEASEVREGLSTHRDRTKRISNEHARAESQVNDGIGSLGRAIQGAVKATHFLTCAVPDRESKEIKYLREATELIEARKHQLQSGQPMSGPPCEHREVVLVVRQR